MSNNKKYSAGMAIMLVTSVIGFTLCVLDKLVIGHVDANSGLIFIVSSASLCVMDHINTVTP
jgi:hypothetical protein